MKKRIGVLLAGCGVKDGSEIHEATLTLLYLDRENEGYICMAPDDDQMHTINHLNETEMAPNRNILIESARIARGDVQALSVISETDLDALILPGGFGAAKNLIDYGVKGRECAIREDVKQIILNMLRAGKPVGAICIAPVVVAVALRDENVSPVLTIGNDPGTASDLEFFGAKHVESPVDDIVFDEENRIVSTPAYMLGPTISHIGRGIEKLVQKICTIA